MLPYPASEALQADDIVKSYRKSTKSKILPR